MCRQGNAPDFRRRASGAGVLSCSDFKGNPCICKENTPDSRRRASRAGVPFPFDLQRKALHVQRKYPERSPVRFARRITLIG